MIKSGEEGQPSWSTEYSLDKSHQGYKHLVMTQIKKEG